jgi:hypothetical protein
VCASLRLRLRASLVLRVFVCLSLLLGWLSCSLSRTSRVCVFVFVFVVWLVVVYVPLWFFVSLCVCVFVFVIWLVVVAVVVCVRLVLCVFVCLLLLSSCVCVCLVCCVACSLVFVSGSLCCCLVLAACLFAPLVSVVAYRFSGVSTIVVLLCFRVFSVSRLGFHTIAFENVCELAVVRCGCVRVSEGREAGLEQLAW